MNNQETYLRKKYLQLVQNFRYLLAKNTEDTNKLNDKYLPKFRKNKFWIKFHITKKLFYLIDNSERLCLLHTKF